MELVVVGSRWYGPSLTLKPTLDQSMVLTGGGGNVEAILDVFW